MIFAEAVQDQIFGEIFNLVLQISRTSESTHEMLVNYSEKLLSYAEKRLALGIA